MVSFIYHFSMPSFRPASSRLESFETVAVQRIPARRNQFLASDQVFLEIFLLGTLVIVCGARAENFEQVQT